MQLTIEDFYNLFHIDSEDENLPSICKSIIEKRDFSYHSIDRDERDKLITEILKKIDSDDLSISGPQRYNHWEEGWSENLEEYKQTHNINSLIPKFIKQDQAIRLQRDYVIPNSKDFEFDTVDVLRTWLFYKYFNDKDNIYEFGCGSCQHLVLLADIFPNKKIIGLDWAESSMKIIDKLNEKYKNIEGRLFNLFDPDYNFKIKDNSGIFTIGTMEQLGNNFEPFLQFLLSNLSKNNGRDSICIHLETIRELYDDNYLLDYLAIKYDEKRGYLNGFLNRLRERDGIVELIKAQRILFGSLYHDGYSLIVWRIK